VTLKLITWNIQWCRGVDGRVDPARIVEQARAFADFDVLCLQEVAANFPALAGSRGENQFELLARLLPGYTAIPGAAVDALAPDASRRAFGNLILSRLPVALALRVQLPWPPDPDVKSMPRVLIDATVEAPFGPLRVMTTHLEYYSARQRAAQVVAIRSHHVEACDRARRPGVRGKPQTPFDTGAPTASAILTADFNFRPDDLLHAQLQAPFPDGAPAFVDAWTVAHPGQPHAHTNGVYDRVQWPESYACDFIFITENLRARVRRVEVDSATRASDHQPVLIELA
jgi:endonuclease/exonuclease/phosphatase family metal-dependent hydrolase